MAHQVYKLTRNLEDLTHLKNLCNKANQYISKEHFKWKSASFKREGLSSKEKWNLAKSKTGQSRFVSLAVITDSDKIFTKNNNI